MPAAHGIKVYATATDVAPVAADEIDGVKDATMNAARTVLDTTDFKDATGAKTKILGLFDGGFSISGDYEEGDAPATLLTNAALSGATVFIHFRPGGGATGFKLGCKVESFEVGGAVDDLVSQSWTLTSTGALTVV